MRPDLVVPGENEENFVVARDARVVTVPFSPIEKRFAKEKPQLMPGLQKLREELGDAEFDRLITRIHNINVSGERCLIVAESELHRTFIIYNEFVVGAWRSLVARLFRVQEAVSSNLAAPTKLKNNRKSGNSWLPDFYFYKPFFET